MKLISYRDPRISSSGIRTGLVLKDETHFIDLLQGCERLGIQASSPDLSSMQSLIAVSYTHLRAHET